MKIIFVFYPITPNTFYLNYKKFATLKMIQKYTSQLFKIFIFNLDHLFIYSIFNLNHLFRFFLIQLFIFVPFNFT